MQYGLRETVCSASASLYCTPSACTSVVPQPVLHILSLYFIYLIQDEWTLTRSVVTKSRLLDKFSLDVRADLFCTFKVFITIDDYAKDGGPGVV